MRPGRSGIRVGEITVEKDGRSIYGRGETNVSPRAIIAHRLAAAIADGLDPVKTPGKVKRFTADEIAKLNADRKKAP